MYVGRDEEHLELQELERVPAHLPTAGDVRLAVSLRLQEFSGGYDGVWVARPALKRFVEQLDVLLRTRKSTARIEAMSPGEFSMELRPVGQLGHYEVRVLLGRHQYSGTTSWPTALSGGFELGPSDLPVILAAFESMLTPSGAS